MLFPTTSAVPVTETVQVAKIEPLLFNFAVIVHFPGPTAMILFAEAFTSDAVSSLSSLATLGFEVVHITTSSVVSPDAGERNAVMAFSSPLCIFVEVVLRLILLAGFVIVASGSTTLMLKVD